MRTKTVAASIMSLIPNGPVTTIEYQPGNDSRYKVVLISYTKDTPSHYVVAVMTEGNGTCMTVANSGPGAPLSPVYVREKLKVSLGDSVVLAELIAHITGRGVAADASLEGSYK